MAAGYLHEAGFRGASVWSGRTGARGRLVSIVLGVIARHNDSRVGGGLGKKVDTRKKRGFYRRENRPIGIAVHL